MKLKSFGCSFIFGSELADDGRDRPYATPSQLTWPSHLAQHLGRDYSCYARPGAGNLQILENILNQSAVSDCNDLFVIGWTWIDRFDYYDADHNPKIKNSNKPMAVREFRKGRKELQQCMSAKSYSTRR